MKSTRTRELGRVGTLTALIVFTAAFVIASPALATNGNGNGNNGIHAPGHHANGNNQGRDGQGDNEDGNGRSGCAGLSGAAAGLCNAYCNAQDCPNNPKPSCESLRNNFAKHTGRSTFPCDVIVPGPTQTPVATTTAAVSTATATAAAPTTTAAAPTATITAAGPTTTAVAPTATTTAAGATATAGAPTVTAAGPTPTAGAPTATAGAPTATAGAPTATVAGPTTTAAAATATPTAGVPTPEPTSTAVGGACPSQITFLANGDAVDLDTGWTGQSHDNRVINNGLVTVNATSCTGSLATVSGPAQNAGGAAANNHRCTGDTSVQCTTDGDCTGLGTCAFFFGAPLPLSSGSVSVCVINQINGALTGTADIVSGDSANTAPLISRVFTGPTLANPCSVCGTGAFGTTSTCSTGPKAGLSCTVNGTSPLFGSTSFDCPPDPGANIAALNITLKLTTGLQTITLAAANPLCTAPGFTTLNCFCDTCGDLGAAACMTNADCAAGVVCGGKRCVSGTNAGAACTTATECPPSNACGRPGNVTKPNDCSDATCTANTPPDNDSVNEGTCAGGPFEQFCNIERFRGCSSDANCTAPGDTCSFGKFRECYTDNGTIGNALQVQGSPDPFVAGVSHGTLGSFFCVGPTTSGSVNAVAGLPGLGRLTLPGTATLIP